MANQSFKRIDDQVVPAVNAERPIFDGYGGIATNWAMLAFKRNV